MTISRFAATEFFNSLPDQQKKAVLENSLGPEVLHDGLQFAVPFWWVFLDQNREANLRSGSAFLVDRGQGVLAITAAHVFRGYCEAKSGAHGIVCQLGDALFDPEACLIAFNEDLDIATKNASRDMLLLLTEQQGLSRDDAYSLMSVAADFAVTQVVDGRQGIHVRIPRTIFPPGKG